MKIAIKRTVNLGDYNSSVAEVELDGQDLTDLCAELNLPEALLTFTERSALLRFKAEVMLYQGLVALGATEARDMAIAVKDRLDKKVTQLSTEHPVADND